MPAKIHIVKATVFPVVKYGNRSQEIPGVTGKFGLVVQNEAGQRLTEFCQESTLESHLVVGGMPVVAT